MSATPALKPCPFGCKHISSDGEPAVVLVCQQDVKNDYAIGYGVRCNECGIEIWEEYKAEAIAAWNKRSVGSSAPLSAGSGVTDLPLEDARREHIEMMVKAAADWLASDDTAYEIDPPSARRAAWGMLKAAFSVVPGPNVVKGPVDMKGAQDVKR